LKSAGLGALRVQGRALAFPDPAKKMAVPGGTAKFREETSKKDRKRQGRLAVKTNIGDGSYVCKRLFAVQHQKSDLAFMGR
jgi:hypothetical protein